VRLFVDGGVQMSPHKSVDRDSLQRATEHLLGETAQTITIKVEGDRVYLYGSVYSLEQRAKLETLALSFRGVAAVENYVCVNLFA